MKKKVIYQNHHVVYPSDRNKERTRRVRKGLHQVLTLLTRFNFLTDEEINAIHLECELRRQFKEGEDNARD